MSLVWTHKLSVNKQLQQRWLGVIGFLISHKTVVPLRYKVRILFPAASFCSLRTRRPKERVRLSSCLLGFLCVLISVPFQQFCFDWLNFISIRIFLQTPDFFLRNSALSIPVPTTRGRLLPALLKNYNPNFGPEKRSLLCERRSLQLGSYKS
jgi:hypothetical protein